MPGGCILGPMPKVRANADARWVRRAGAAGQDYSEGIQSPRADWQASTLAAAPAQAAGVQAAIAAGSFARGVQKAGSGKWQSKALSKGVQRFGPGVAEAQADYARGVAPYLAAISSISLPARGPKGDPRNLERVRVIAQALRALKVGGARA